MSASPTPEQLMALSPEYLAQDIGAKLTNTSIAFIILLSVIYALYIISQMFFVERTSWTMWTLYPLGYLFSLSLAIICICMCLHLTALADTKQIILTLCN
jgi:hypothetical protein